MRIRQSKNVFNLNNMKVPLSKEKQEHIEEFNIIGGFLNFVKILGYKNIYDKKHKYLQTNEINLSYVFILKLIKEFKSIKKMFLSKNIVFQLNSKILKQTFYKSKRKITDYVAVNNTRIRKSHLDFYNSKEGKEFFKNNPPPTSFKFQKINFISKCSDAFNQKLIEIKVDDIINKK